jgi:hypothetical protein
MTDRYLSRAGWGVNTSLPRLGFAVAASKRTEVHVHHTAAVDTSDFTKNRWTIKNAIKYQRQLQTIRPDLGKDIPYTEVFYVLENLDVTIMEGRGLSRTGAHTAGHNTAGLGWAVAGNFDLGDPDAINVVIASIDNRIRWLRKSGFPNLTDTHPTGRTVYGHRDTKATACPGAHLFAALPRITLDPPTPQTPPPVGTTGTPVMGDAQVSLGQAVEFVTQRATGAAYPSDTIRKIVDTTWQVADADGVRADLAIGLMAKETGFFRYGGDVKADQWNFGGIGATGGVPGVRFLTLEAGVKAVVRRMRMYAVHDRNAYDPIILGRGLSEIGVPADEPGFHGWGKHPNIEDFNGAWATPGIGYGESIVAMVETMKAVPVPSEPSTPFTDSEVSWLDGRYVRR